MRTPIKKARSSGERKFEAFDFTEDDERVEKTSRKLLSKFNPKKSKKTEFSSPIDKYKFLQFFAKGAENEQNNSTNEPLDVDDGADKIEERILRVDASVPSEPKSCFPRARRFEGSVHANKHSNCGLPEIPIDIEPVSLDTDDDQSIEFQSASDIARCGGVSEDDLLDVDSNLCNTEKLVVITPDYIIYGDMYSMEAQLTFSSQGINIEGSAHFGTKRPFSFRWATSEIVNIQSTLCESVKMAEMSLCFKSKDMKVADIANKSSGIMKLTFAVSDSYWSQREEAIQSLDLRYKAAWNSASDESDKVVVYPKGDPDAVSISKTDIELLQPERFINDTIIDFYIKHLVNRLRPIERQRFYFFNSFFFRKLADLDKDSSRAHEGRVAFQRVHKWTKKVNLFEKDFIFIPVNFSLHWSLIVICHPGEVVNFRDKEMEKSSKLPCILHMDSIRGSHRGLRNLFQSYLWEEWKNRHDGAAEDVSRRFLNLRFIPLELPQQQNSFDCGLFLLHYVELFLENAPVDFNPLNLTQSSSFLRRDWFPPAKASEKRACIRKLIIEIFGDDFHEDPLAASDGKYSLHDVSEGNICIDFTRETCGAREGYSCADPKLNPDEDVQITSRVDTPLKVLQCSGKLDFLFGDPLSPEKIERSASDGNLQQEAQVVTNKLNKILSPIEEEKEFWEQASLPRTEKAQSQQAVEIGKPLSTPYKAGSLRATPTKCFSKIFVNLEEYDPVESSPGISASQPLALAEAQDDGDCVPVILVAPSPENANYVFDSSSMSNEELADCIIEDSEENEELADCLNDNANSSLCQARAFALSLEEVDSTDKTDYIATQTQNLSGLERKRDARKSRCSVQSKGHQARSLFEDLD